MINKQTRNQEYKNWIHSYFGIRLNICNSYRVFFFFFFFFFSFFKGTICEVNLLISNYLESVYMMGARSVLRDFRELVLGLR